MLPSMLCPLPATAASSLPYFSLFSAIYFLYPIRSAENSKKVTFIPSHLTLSLKWWSSSPECTSRGVSRPHFAAILPVIGFDTAEKHRLLDYQGASEPNCQVASFIPARSLYGSEMSPFPAFYRVPIVPLLFRETIIPLEPSQSFPVWGEKRVSHAKEPHPAE